MCGLLIAFMVAAGLWSRRRNGVVARVDFSMIEAMLWTMSEPLLQTQLSDRPKPRGNQSDRCAPHGVYRCAGDDQWVGIAVRNDTEWRALCDLVPGLESVHRSAADDALSAWCVPRLAGDIAASLARAGIPAAPVTGSFDLVESAHLRARGFWDALGAGVVPGLSWRASYGRVIGPAPGLGEHTDVVLGEVLGLGTDRISALRASGALG
jgi:crotonobetainyl-CoA:carnitine CoA-transferase CaiB-like acyl-CoA transferase